MAGRYLPNLLITIELAALAMVVDLIFGVPFAYILVRKVRYREVVRAFMVFPMFGALYIAFGLGFMLLPGGPLAPLLDALGISSVSALYGLPVDGVRDGHLHVPVHGHERGRGAQQRRSHARGGGRLPGGAAVADIPARPHPADTRAGSIAGMLMVFGWNLGAFAEPLLLGRHQRAAHPRAARSTSAAWCSRTTDWRRR